MQYYFSLYGGCVWNVGAREVLSYIEENSYTDLVPSV